MEKCVLPNHEYHPTCPHDIVTQKVTVCIRNTSSSSPIRFTVLDEEEVTMKEQNSAKRCGL
jgi:hypothetical protein